MAILHTTPLWKWLPFALAGLWLVISFVQLSAWHHFVRLHRATGRPPGRKYVTYLAWLGGPSSRPLVRLPAKNVVRCVFSEGGIYFQVHWLFRPFHPPFIVPWESVQEVESKSGIPAWTALFTPDLDAIGRRCRISIEDPAGNIEIRLHVRGQLEHDLRQYWHGL